MINYWIIKGNPADYDWDKGLRPGHVEPWGTRFPEAAMTKGDRVFLWESGGRSRVIGFAVVVGVDGSKDGEWHFSVEYLSERFDCMPGIAELRSDPAVRGASFLKPGVFRTIYPLTGKQASAIYRTVVSSNPADDIWRDLARVPRPPDMNLRPLLSARLPVLRQTHEDEFRRLEKERLRFVRDYSLKKLPHLTLEEYAIGRGKGTFCYRIERELDDLGRILGSPARKFGVYFSRDENRYLYTSIWGINPESAYTRLRSAIIQLLQDAAAGDIEALKASRISPMFKGKLLHLYFPEEFAPIFSPEHLKHFVSCLNLSGEYGSSIERQQALMEFRRNQPLLCNEPVGLMMRFLYDSFPPDAEPPETEEEKAEVPPKVSLSEALAGLRQIGSLPKAKPLDESGPHSPTPGKFDPNSGRRKFIGDRGEALVLEFERSRLRAAQRPELAKKVTHVAATDDSRGYDILSFDADGTPRQIEVKSTTGSNLARGFYITANEVNASKTEPNYHLYFVFNALSASPLVFPMKKPTLAAPEFDLRPTQFRVTSQATP